ncbi:hypothetical protein QMM95_05840 [Leptospira santarosai]|nr:hypothetical protein [Leptospira santarosai]EMM78064.1 hypothetical protein LEP1GSC040_1799 [Leptospira santarosai str. 2000030832]MDI7235609.1 hypothetical protein [Leptospira santarosai]
MQKKTAELTLRTTESDRKRKTLSVLKPVKFDKEPIDISLWSDFVVI